MTLSERPRLGDLISTTLAHSDLLGKYNDLLKKHNESLVLAKQVEESHKKLK